MRTLIAVMLLVFGTCTVSMAGGIGPVPEIDATTGVAALGLIVGAVFIIRGRHKK